MCCDQVWDDDWDEEGHPSWPYEVTRSCVQHAQLQGEGGRLCGANLENCLRIYDQTFFNEDTLPKTEILAEWLRVKNRRMVEK